MKKILGLVLIIAGSILMSVMPIKSQSFPSLAHVEIRGNGPTKLLLIPCGGCDWHSWETFMERNCDRYTMYAVTLPGLGGSKPIEISETAKGTPLLDAYANIVASYIVSKGLKDVVIVGHSVGAAVGLKVVLDNPGVARKIFLVDWGAIHPESLSLSLEEKIQRAENSRLEILKTSDEEFHTRWSGMIPRFIANPGRVPAYQQMFRTVSRIASAQLAYEMMLYDLRRRLPEIKIPICAVFGIGSGTDSATKRKKALAVIKDAHNPQIAFLEDTGHWIMEERPNEFDRAVSEFVSGQKIKEFSK
jgi:pimeloyl-ACP methyl ester carboxylesterase